MRLELSTEQRVAPDCLMSSLHYITVFRGGAGTGKSYVLREFADQVAGTNRPVIVVRITRGGLGIESGTKTSTIS